MVLGVYFCLDLIGCITKNGYYALNKNHWMNEDIPWSWSCTVKFLFNGWIFTHWTWTLLVQWLNFQSLNKDFTLQHHEPDIFSFVQWFFFEGVQSLSLLYLKYRDRDFTACFSLVQLQLMIYQTTDKNNLMASPVLPQYLYTLAFSTNLQRSFNFRQCYIAHFLSPATSYLC